MRGEADKIEDHSFCMHCLALFKNGVSFWACMFFQKPLRTSEAGENAEAIGGPKQQQLLQKYGVWKGFRREDIWLKGI